MALRGALLACLCCLSLAVGGVAIQPVAAETCYTPAAVAVSGAGPGVVAVGPGVAGSDPSLHRYDDSLTERSNASLRDRLTAAQRDAFDDDDDGRVAGIERDPDGRWWVLFERGVVLSLHGNWTGTGATVWLNESDPPVRDLARAEDTWVVLDQDGLRSYDDRWQHRTVAAGDHRSGARAVAASDGALLTLAGNGTVTRYAVSRRSNGSLALTRRDATSLDLNRTRFGEPIDVASADGGWFLLTDEGALLAFDDGATSLTHRGYVANGPVVYL